MKNLLGLMINEVEITENTPNEVWKGKHSTHFDCYRNKLESLEYCPRILYGDFDCADNELKTLEHCPKEIHCNFYCNSNRLESLHNIHKYLKEMDGIFYASYNPIKSHVLGLLLVKGSTGVILDNKKVENILNKYLPNNSGMKSVFECQEELLFAGLEEFAQL